MKDASTIWDPLRKKDVALTPEESVRQWFIQLLNKQSGVPLHLMGSEVELKYGVEGKTYRADIVVYGKNTEPVAIVECKRAEVNLSQQTVAQALRYDYILNVKYIFITNGNSNFVCKRENGNFVFLDRFPTYEEMICQQ